MERLHLVSSNYPGERDILGRMMGMPGIESYHAAELGRCGQNLAINPQKFFFKVDLRYGCHHYPAVVGLHVREFDGF